MRNAIVLWQLFTMPSTDSAGLRTTLVTQANRYQSLHTSVVGISGRPVQPAHTGNASVAEYGIAAHWKYKETGSSNHPVNRADDKFTWLQLLEWQNDLKDAQEYLESIKDNLFEDDVFTPKEM